MRVAGSSGAYFYSADTIIQMDCYGPLDITEKTKKACAEYGEDPTKAAPGFSLPAPGRKLAMATADAAAMDAVGATVTAMADATAMGVAATAAGVGATNGSRPRPTARTPFRWARSRWTCDLWNS